MKDTDLAYLAGLIDGEGTISCSITRTQRGHLALHKQLSIFNTNVLLISWITARFYGKVFSRKRSDVWKEEHQVKWSADDAVLILQQVLPYLVIKREQAEIFIALHKTKSYVEVTAEVQDYRQKLVQRLQELNKRGST